MSFGFDPRISSWSPYHGAVYAVLQSAARIVAMGGDYRRIRLTFQEYFERLGEDPERWGKPLAALLGAFHAQEKLGIAAIGGKDSMSGSFEKLDVPPHPGLLRGSPGRSRQGCIPGAEKSGL